MTDSDFFFLPDGSTCHLSVKKGDVFPRILTVGSRVRAELVATLLDEDRPVKRISGDRQYFIVTGYYEGVGISIIAIGMGCPLMDFMMREASFVEPLPWAVIRLGTCGIFRKDKSPGTIMTCGKGSMFVYTNYVKFDGNLLESDTLKEPGASSLPYLMTKPVPCHLPLQESLIAELDNAKLAFSDGLNASGETFYSCQGRVDRRFNDSNEYVLQTLIDAGVTCMDMETHQLFHLAKRRRIPCYTAAALIGVVNRVDKSSDYQGHIGSIEKLELECGRCCLKALAKFVL